MPEELTPSAAPAAAESVPAPAAPSAPVEAPAAPAEAPKSIEDTLRETTSRVWQKNNPPREAGRFAPRTPADTSPPQAATPDQPPNVALEPDTPPAIEAPHSWSADDRTAWAKAPPEVQAIVARREVEAHRRITQMGEQIRSHEQDPVRQVYEQHADYLRQIGRTPEEAARKTFEVSRALDNNPAAAIAWLANAYRVNLQHLVNGQQQPNNAPQRDVQLETRVRRMETEHQARLEAERIQQQRAVESTIDNFATAKDHPFFEELNQPLPGTDVPLLLASINKVKALNPYGTPEQWLKAAYEDAAETHPTVKERIRQDQRKAAEEKRRVEAEKQAAEAKRQQPLNQRSSKGVMPAPGSLDDSIRRNLKRAMGG